MADMDFTIAKDNTKAVEEALKIQVRRGLWAIGATAEGYAKDQLYDGHGLDTGRLRNSITFGTIENEGQSFSYSDNQNNDYSDKIGTGAKESEVHIGTNVEYAPYVELGTQKMAGLHYLAAAITGHGDEFKKLMTEALK